jgi:hypothetical protein
MKWPAFAFCVLSLAATGMVAAQETPSSRRKSREQVREEVQAWRDGLLPYKRYEYPPRAETISRNKELYAITHPDDAAVKEACNQAE